MGAFETWTNVHYPGENDGECSWCGGEGYREFPNPLLDPTYDPCPYGCDPMEDDTRIYIVEFEHLAKSALWADRVPETEIRDRDIARLMWAVDTVKNGKRPHKTWRFPVKTYYKETQ